jgi:hypothetical protein
MRIILLSFLLMSCATPVYKYVYEIKPRANQICRYKKVANMQRKKIVCYNLNSKKEDGKYRFENTLVITKRAMRELLRKQLDALFGK